jgi:RNA polymerase sigma factor (sigma-70 family)
VPVTAVDAAPSARDLAGEVADRQAVMDALARLPQRQRACVVLRYFDDLSISEVAALLGVNEGTVKSQTSRGLVSLRTIFVGETRDEPVATGPGGHRGSVSGLSVTR